MCRAAEPRANAELRQGLEAGKSQTREQQAAAGGVDYAAVSVRIKRFERRLVRERPLSQAVENANQLLNVEARPQFS
jgi:hypothetical protein